MARTLLGFGSVAVLMFFSGCQMCCHPYDQCGPVYSHSGCSSCSSHSRAGSIFADAGDGMLEQESQPTIAPRQPTLAPQQPTPATRPQAEKQAKRHVSKQYKETQASSGRTRVKGDSPIFADTKIGTVPRKHPQRQEQAQVQKRRQSQVPAQAQTKQVQRQTKHQRQEQEQVPTQAQAGYVPGSERIVSVTERVVGAETASSVGAKGTVPFSLRENWDSPQAVSKPKSTESPETLPSDGWTARRYDTTQR